MKDTYRKEDRGECIYYANTGRHRFSDEKLIKTPDCTRPGSMLLTCTCCGRTFTRHLPPLSHRFDRGLLFRRCRRCGNNYPTKLTAYILLAFALFAAGLLVVLMSVKPLPMRHMTTTRPDNTMSGAFFEETEPLSTAVEVSSSPETTVEETSAADTSDEETIFPETVQAVTAPVETTAFETTAFETAPLKTMPPETVPPQTLPPETPPTQTLPQETVILPHETTAQESAAEAETSTIAETTIIAETTTIAETTAIEETTTTEETTVTAETTTEEDSAQAASPPPPPPDYSVYSGRIFTGEQIIELYESGAPVTVIKNNGMIFTENIIAAVVVSDSYTCMYSDGRLIFNQF
ncbi:MAG: hypothetical protein IKN24_06305 [Lachnospiraceae bacterium]|nr:hypothetical protein [Lachnospiraceae bacterium]